MSPLSCVSMLPIQAQGNGSPVNALWKSVKAKLLGAKTLWSCHSSIQWDLWALVQVLTHFNKNVTGISGTILHFRRNNFFPWNSRRSSLDIAGMYHTSICHTRAGPHWRVANARYMRKVYMETTWRTFRNNLTFRRSQTSHNVGIPINFVGWTYQVLKYCFPRILLLEGVAHMHKKKWNLLFNIQELSITVS